MKKYDIILMDLDDTITDHKLSRMHSIARICDLKGIKYDNKYLEDFIMCDDKFWDDDIVYPSNVLTFEEKKNWSRAQRFIKHFGDIEFEEALYLDKEYNKMLSENIVPLENAVEVVKYLSNKYKLFIATNGPAIAVKSKLRRANVFDFFSGVFVAEELGYLKPAKEFFEIVMQQTGYTDVKKIAIIGDSLTSDIEGGNNVNIDTYWFNHRGKEKVKDVKVTQEFIHLKQLYNIL